MCEWVCKVHIFLCMLIFFSNPNFFSILAVHRTQQGRLTGIEPLLDIKITWRSCEVYKSQAWLVSARLHPQSF